MTLLKKLSVLIVENIFFKRKLSLICCSAFSILSLCIEYIFRISNFFSSSGTVFTIAGLFLTIKLTAHFHLKLPDGKPLGNGSKHAMITGRSTFGGNETPNEKERRVKEVEADEIWGAIFMVVGTIIWGYGSYLIQAIAPHTMCPCP